MASLLTAEEWREKRGLSSKLEVRESELFGRGLFAAAALPRGAEIMRAEPLVHVLSNDVRGHLCDYCLKESETLLKCGRCKFVRYCSKTCQRGDWRCHGGECRGLARAHPHTPTSLTRLVARCVHIHREETTRHGLELLCSSEGKLSPEVQEEAATLMFGVRMLLENVDSAILKAAYTILCKALCNTFAIHGEGLDAIGAALYEGPSLLNHCCVPNCVAVFAGLTVLVRTIKPVQLGEQLLLSYVDLVDGREQRRDTLLRSYTFICDCQRCLTELEPNSPFQAMYASVEGCSDVAVKEVVQQELETLKSIEKLRQKGDCALVMTECEGALQRQKAVLCSSHHVTVKTLQQLVYACIVAGDWPKAIDACRKLTEPLQRCLPEYHPVLAIHWLRLGKLCRVIDTTDNLTHSVSHLTQAVRQLRVVYGSDHSCTQEALQMLHDSQSELTLRRNST